MIIPVSLWLFHYLDGVAREALRAFRPATDASDAEIERLRYELTVIPARPAAVLLIATMIVTPGYYLLDPVASDVVGLTPVGMALRYVIEVLFGGLLVVLRLPTRCARCGPWCEPIVEPSTSTSSIPSHSMPSRA